MVEDDGAVVGVSVIFGALVTGGGLHVVSEPDESVDFEVASSEPEPVFGEGVRVLEGASVVGVVVGASVSGALVAGGGLNVVSPEDPDEDSGCEDDELGFPADPVDDEELPAGSGVEVVGSLGTGGGLHGVGSGVGSGAAVVGTGASVGVSVVDVGASVAGANVGRIAS